MTATVARTEYDSGRLVFAIDDGETHHYVAPSAWEALQAHLVDYDYQQMADEFTAYGVDPLAPDSRLSVTWIDGWDRPEDEADFPAEKGFEITANKHDQPVVTATAADWAAYYADAGKVVQISTTCC